MSKSIILTGNNLTIQDIEIIVQDPEVSLEIAESALHAIRTSREFLEREVHKRIIYGVNTGFGPMASYIINHGQSESLQENLIRSHAVGLGDPIEDRYVLATMVIRLNTFAKGYSGVSPELVSQLQTFINHRILPIVPEHGAVGTSGDLVQLAHVALALTGEGEVMYKGKRELTSHVLQQLQIQPYKLKIKEGLSLINGTSTMTGIGAMICSDTKQLLSISVRLGALALEIVHGFDDSISEKLHSVRPHTGQRIIAQALRELLASSQTLRKRNNLKQPAHATAEALPISEVIQEFYSLRCIPQILGPVFDAYCKTTKDMVTEMNSATDNPIVDWENDIFLHGGNFHGDYIAASLDQLKMTLVKLTMLSERRLNFFLNSQINRFFPPFLNLNTPGLTLALQGLQFVATSTTAQNQTLAFPHYVHSISTNADNQDIVSMGTDVALFTAKVIENAYIVLSIEVIALAQAVDVLANKHLLSQPSRELFEHIREIFPAIEHDRVLVHELPKVVHFLKQNKKLHVEALDTP